MGFLGKLFGKNAVERPAWAHVLSNKEYAKFEEVIRRVAADRFPQGTLDLEEGFLKADWVEIGFHNLIHYLKQAPAAEWEMVTQDFLGVTWDGEMETARAMAMPFEDVRSLLRIRLYASDSIPGDFAGAYPGSPPGTTGILCVDLPSIVTSITPEQADRYGLPHDELLEIALQNVWDRCPPAQRGKVDATDNHEILISEHHFMASHALLLERHFDPWPTYGVAYFTPCRNILVTRPLMGPGDIPGLNVLATVAATMYENEAGGIVPYGFLRTKDQHMVLDLSPGTECHRHLEPILG